MHMRYKTNQIDDSIPFVQTHIEPMFAPSGPVRAPLAPDLLLRPPPVQSRSLRPSVRGQTFFPLLRFGPAPLFRPSGFTSLIGLRPPLPGTLCCPHPGLLPLSSARPRPHRSPELSPAVPLRPCPRPKTHNMEPAQHDDGPKS